jgi:hypothetical protein
MFDIENKKAKVISNSTRRWLSVDNGRLFFWKHWSRRMPKLMSNREIDMMLVQILSRNSNNE